jgi:peptide/nickel transport system permease protein
MSASSTTPSTPSSVRRRGTWLPVRWLAGRGLVVQVSAGIILLASLVAVFGKALALHDYEEIRLSRAFEGSSSEHWLGLDHQGRDVVSRLLVGARNSMLGALLVVTLSTVFGTGVAILAAWRRGTIDRMLNSGMNLLFAFPGVLLAVLVAAVFGPSLLTAGVALSVAYTPYLARVIRSAALRERDLPYITLLEVQGHPALRICRRHLLPNIATMIAAQATLVFGYAMADLAAVSFIGLGVQSPGTDWGLMVAEGQSGVIQGYPMASIAAGACIVVVVIAFNLLGERLAERSPSS